MDARIALIEHARHVGDGVGFNLFDTLRLIEALKRAGDVDSNTQVTLPMETE